MNQEQPRDRDAGSPASKDIGPILQGWDYEPGTINVRKIIGVDGRPKVQMRVDMGLIQMELTGRPDGQRPHGCESLLDYYESQLAEHRRRFGTELGFTLSTEQCQSLREEAFMYYQRYLSLFVLEDFAGVVRDTSRNLRAMDLCWRYAGEEPDRLMMEPYRPYITMMNTRAMASILYQEKRYREAIAAVEHGLEKMRDFYARFGQERKFNKANEVRILKRFAREIRRKLPVDPLHRLQEKLHRAVKAERYEEAARLRDEIASRRRSSCERS